MGQNQLNNKNGFLAKPFLGIPIYVILIAFSMYASVGLFQAFEQSWYTTRYEVTLFDLNAPSTFLCVRYPTWLATDGASQQGIISISLTNSTDSCESNPEKAAQILETTNAATSTSLSQTHPNSTTVTSMATLSTTLTISNVTNSTPIPIDNSLPIVPQTNIQLNPMSFALQSSTGLRFVDSQDATYSPLLTLRLGSEVSVKLENARKKSYEKYGTIQITHVATGRRIPALSRDTNIKLESAGWGFLRKFWGILLTPATGGVTLLVPLLLGYIQEREKKRTDEEQTRQDRIQQDKSELLKRMCKELPKRIHATPSPFVLELVTEELDQIDNLVSDFRMSSNQKEDLRVLNDMLVDRYISYAKANSARFTNSDNVLVNLLERLRKLDNSPARKRTIEDIVFLLLRKTSKNQEHSFSDPFFLGYYANASWSQKKMQDHLKEQLNQFPDDIASDTSLLHGMFCSYLTQSNSNRSNSLLSNLGDDYVQDQITTDTPWRNRLSKLFEEEHSEQPEFKQWCQVRTDEKRKTRSLHERINSDRRSARFFWPLDKDKIFNAKLMRNDSNYTFPEKVQDISGLANRSSYYLFEQGLPAPTKQVSSAFELCKKWLANHEHSLVTGEKGSGKTWLRIYLEYFSLSIGEKSLPVFYFPPVMLTYHFDDLILVRSLALSVANHLFADLILRSGESISDKDLRVSRAAIIPFLKVFGYDVFDESDCLAQPIPTQQRLSIDAEYGQSYHRAAYLAMKEMLEQPIDSPYSLLATNHEEILDMIQHAMEIADYRSLFIFIDNWEHVPDIPRNRLLHKMLQPNFLQELQKRQLFLKLFMPSTDELPLTHFQKTCDIIRFESKGTSNEEIPPHLLVDAEETTRFPLQLYTYHESIVQPDVVQPTTS